MWLKTGADNRPQRDTNACGQYAFRLVAPPNNISRLVTCVHRSPSVRDRLSQQALGLPTRRSRPFDCLFVV
ncbi:unnamed protein product [Mycena citricolor]|uniref:Uncharacterized protein n=1 Tax=Mycena citricolor TaxID=2018698 RepID=A0AAD2K8K2_9AGAR|nr:unnamed protein product [Mycena citricolor]